MGVGKLTTLESWPKMHFKMNAFSPYFMYIYQILSSKKK